MKHAVALSLIALLFQSKPAPSPEIASYRARMDHAQDIQDIILDGFESSDAKVVAAQARELTRLLAEEKRHWERANLEPAIRLGEESVRLSEKMANDAAARKLLEAEEDNKQLQKTCRTCHDAHFKKQVY